MKNFTLYLCLLILNTSANLPLFAIDSTKKKAPDSYLKAVIVESLKKTGKAKLDLYVMSFCPFGVNAEKAIVPILQEMGNSIDFNIFFIVNEKPDKTFQSLHGEPEVLENRRQLVIERHFPSLFLSYLLERSSDYFKDDWSKSARAAGLDVNCINELINQKEEIDAFRENIANSNTKKVFASPSLFINGIRFRGSFSTGSTNLASQCEGGINNGKPCQFFTDCPHACVGGFNHGEECIVDVNCHGICEGGFKPGSECISNDTECPNACVGGARAGQECVSDVNCPAACVGGPNAGKECFTDVNCPQSTCGPPGTCSNKGKCNTDAKCSNKGDCKELKIWYLDWDGDGYHNGQMQEGTKSPGPGWTDSPRGGGDCNDDNQFINPGASEPCGPPDINCDGKTLECPPINIKVNSACQTGHIVLIWETEAIIGVDNFLVERSSDGIHWEQVGSFAMPGQNEAGKKYSFTDMQSDVHSNFYRVIAYSSGSKRYSDLVGSPCPSVQNLTIAPNPVENNLTTISIPSLKNTPLTLALHDSKGVVVQVRHVNLHLGKNQFQFDLGKLPSGLYILTGKYEGFVKKFKIIKN